MGSSISTINNNKDNKKRKNSLGLWSNEEKIKIENATKNFEKIAKYVSEYFYYGIPVKLTHQSIDPLSPLWVTPDTNKVMQRVQASEQDNLQKDWEMIQSAPTTVMITHKGQVIVVFERDSVQYDLMIDNIIAALERFELPIPFPPYLENATTTSLTISWKLQDPPGVAQYVEVQYRKYRQSLNPDIIQIIQPPSSWSTLVCKSWNKESFTSYQYTNLLPGTFYQFRLRYRNHRGLTEYSEPSEIFSTLPDHPSTPLPPTTSVILPHSIHLSWTFPWHNGAIITHFVLEGKAVGEDTFYVLFHGLMLSHIVFNLTPNNAYIFRLKAINSIGESNYSEYFSVRTPEQYSIPLRLQDWRNDLFGNSDESLLNDSYHFDSLYYNAMRCKDAWRQFYDQQTQQIFYFNILTGSRQLQKPFALLNDSSLSSSNIIQNSYENEINNNNSQNNNLNNNNNNHNNQENSLNNENDNQNQNQNQRITDVERELQQNIQFRLKRFRFMKDLRQFRQDTNLRAGTSPSRSSNTLFNLEVNRSTMLSDTYLIFSSLRSGGVGGELRKRLRVKFIEEDGIDAGGLTKEFYLLLSKQMIEYIIYSNRKWIKMTSSNKIFFNEIKLKHSEEIYNNDNNDNNDNVDDNNNKINNKNNNRDINQLSKNKLNGIEKNFQTLNRVNGQNYIRFIGRVIGKALYDNQMIDIPLSGILLSYMANSLNGMMLNNENTSKGNNNNNRNDTKKNINEIFDNFGFNEQDFQDYDPELYKSIKWMIENNIEGIIDSTFTVTGSNGEEVILCKDGNKKDVTEENKHEYISYLVQWKTQYSVSWLLQEFLAGFWELIPFEVLKKNNINSNDLDLMLNGKPSIDVEEIRAYTIFQGSEDFVDNHPQIILLWQIIRQFNLDNQRKFLHFVTGTSRIPLDGFDPPFNITQGIDMEKDSLPRSHTCFNQIVIPEYSSIEIMREKILFAITETEGFHLT